MESNLEAVGKRLPYLAKYKASVDKDKKLTGVNIKIFCDSGANYNESTADIAVGFAKSVYVRLLNVDLENKNISTLFPQPCLETEPNGGVDRHTIKHLLPGSRKHSGKECNQSDHHWNFNVTTDPIYFCRATRSWRL